MSKPACGVVYRIMLEHMAHAGTKNGDLIVTYRDFKSYGVRDKSITDGIAMAESLGWIDVVERGRASFEDERFPSRYGLTWLPRADGTLASNRWRKLRSRAEAKAVLRVTEQRRAVEREGRVVQAKRRQRSKREPIAKVAA